MWWPEWGSYDSTCWWQHEIALLASPWPLAYGNLNLALFGPLWKNGRRAAVRGSRQPSSGGRADYPGGCGFLDALAAKIRCHHVD